MADMKRGAEGAWGSSRHHKREMVEAPKKERRRCGHRFGDSHCVQRATHYGTANGIALTRGCRWHIAIWVKHGDS